MIPAAFDYHSPTTLDEELGIPLDDIVVEHGNISGGNAARGHSGGR